MVLLSVSLCVALLTCLYDAAAASGCIGFAIPWPVLLSVEMVCQDTFCTQLQQEWHQEFAAPSFLACNCVSSASANTPGRGRTLAVLGLCNECHASLSAGLVLTYVSCHHPGHHPVTWQHVCRVCQSRAPRDHAQVI
jgi:hypothetical protein